MKITNYRRKTVVTDLYTVEHNKKTYYYIRYTNGKGKLISEDLRTQQGKIIQKKELLSEIKRGIS